MSYPEIFMFLSYKVFFFLYYFVLFQLKMNFFIINIVKLFIIIGIVAKSEKRDKFQVTQTSVPYLAALVSVSEEVRCRCHLKYHNNNHFTNGNQLNNEKAPNASLIAQSLSSTSLLLDDSNFNNR